MKNRSQMIWFDFWCFNATFNNISAISWRPVLVAEEAGVPGENHRSWASNCHKWTWISSVCRNSNSQDIVYQRIQKPPDIKYRTQNLALYTSHFSFLKVQFRIKATLQIYSIFKLLFQNTEPTYILYKKGQGNVLCYGTRARHECGKSGFEHR
jgi:hypothetical protein